VIAKTTADMKKFRNAGVFFYQYLEPGLFACALGWVLLLGTTLLVSYLPRSSGLYVQRWWLWGSAPLVMFMAAMAVLLGKGLNRSNCAVLVPGWRRANLAVVLAWTGVLILVPFATGGAWAWYAGERWEITSLAWLCVAVGVGFIAASVLPAVGSFWRTFGQIFTWLSLFASAVGLTLGSQTLTREGAWLGVVADHPWFVAVAAAVSAVALFAGASRRHIEPSKSMATKWIHSLRRATLGGSRRMQGRWPLLRSGLTSTAAVSQIFSVIFLCWFVVVPQSNSEWFLLFYVLWFGFLTATFLADLSLPRAASMLMWLPSGLKRAHLGFEIFQILLRRLFNLAVSYALVIAVSQWTRDQRIGLLVHPEVFLLLLGYATLLAGVAVASHRPGNGKLKRVLISMVAVLLLPGAYSLVLRVFEPSATLDITFSLVFFAIGLLFGKRFSSHWGRQEISALLKPLKTLP
jgi:hypothetical protein